MTPPITACVTSGTRCAFGAHRAATRALGLTSSGLAQNSRAHCGHLLLVFLFSVRAPSSLHSPSGPPLATSLPLARHVHPRAGPWLRRDRLQVLLDGHRPRGRARRRQYVHSRVIRSRSLSALLEKWPKLKTSLRNVLWAGVDKDVFEVSLLAKKKSKSPFVLIHVTGTVAEADNEPATAFAEAVMAAAYSGQSSLAYFALLD